MNEDFPYYFASKGFILYCFFVVIKLEKDFF